MHPRSPVVACQKLKIPPSSRVAAIVRKGLGALAGATDGPSVVPVAVPELELEGVVSKSVGLGVFCCVADGVSRGKVSRQVCEIVEELTDLLRAPIIPPAVPPAVVAAARISAARLIRAVLLFSPQIRLGLGSLASSVGDFSLRSLLISCTGPSGFT